MRTRLQMEESVSRESKAIVALQVHLKSTELSRIQRHKLEVDIYNRIHTRYVAIQALKQLSLKQLFNH
jgi:hypothetical protein